MSIDLHVFGRSEKVAAALVDVLRDQIVEESERFRLVSRRGRGAARPAFSIDGPFRVERQDVPAEVLALVVGPDVQFQVSVSDDSGTTMTLARRTCLALARAWFGEPYTSVVAPHVGMLPLLRTAEHPNDAHPLPVPSELQLSGYRNFFGEPEGTPARLVPLPLPAYRPPPSADG